MSELEPEPQSGPVWYVPDDQEEGVYGENVAVWISPYGFVLDFGAYQLAQEDESGNFVAPMRVVARVRIPAGLAFDMIRTISDKMAHYERAFGSIHVPELQQEQEDDDSED